MLPSSMHYSEEAFYRIIDAGLKEDLGDGDHSTLSCIEADAKGSAVLWLKQEGILAGLAVSEKIFKYIEPACVFNTFMSDGDSISVGDRCFEVKASVHTILKVERLVLNCMQRMSGIATLTQQFVKKISGYHSIILDTRKTTPGFRLLEKEAVRIGGARNHRFGLYDMIMLKDNHVDYCGGIEKAIQRAREYITGVRPGLKLEIETKSLDQLRKVVLFGQVDRIMLDNFTPDQVSEALTIINKSCETESSGGINAENIEAYAKTGVDFISVGALIHQARSLDMSLKAFSGFGH